jgi:hypothetical protein
MQYGRIIVVNLKWIGSENFLDLHPKLKKSNIAFLMRLFSSVCTKILGLSVMAASGRLHVFASSDCQSSCCLLSKEFTTSVDLVHRQRPGTNSGCKENPTNAPATLYKLCMCNCALRSCHIITLFLHCQQARNWERFETLREDRADNFYIRFVSPDFVTSSVSQKSSDILLLYCNLAWHKF